MPSEYRFLVFSPKEAVTAPASYARAHGKPLPEGKIVAAEPVGEIRVNGHLLVDTGVGPPSVVAFDPEEILEAVIGYCLDRKIPLPLVSEKTLERLHGRFALRIGQVDSIEMQMRTHAMKSE